MAGRAVTRTVSLVSVLLLAGVLLGEEQEKLLCSFEKEEVTAWEWAYEVKEVNADLYEVYPESSSFWNGWWQIEKGDATDGDWAYRDVVEGSRWSAEWKTYAGLRPHDEGVYPNQMAYWGNNAQRFCTFYKYQEGWFRKAFSKDWSAYAFLRIDIKCDVANVKIWVGLEDDEIEPYVRRDFQFTAGEWFTLEIDLEQAVEERGLDLQNMRNLWTFVWEVTEPATIRMDNIRLAKAGAPTQFTVLHDDTSMRLPEPPLPVLRTPVSIKPDYSPLKNQEPTVLDVSPVVGEQSFDGFGNPSYRFFWRGGPSAFDNNHIALLAQLWHGYGGVLVTSDGGMSWKGLDGGSQPVPMRTHGHAMCTAADRGDILLVRSTEPSSGTCGGLAGPTDRLWFMKLSFTDDASWNFDEPGFVSCDPRHCPYTYSVVRLPSGRIWMSWAETDRQGEKSLHLKYSDDAGKTWLSFRPDRTGCVDDSPGLKVDCGHLAPCGGSAMCVYSKQKQAGFSAKLTWYTIFYGGQWSVPQAIEGSCGSIRSVLEMDEGEVLVSEGHFGNNWVHHWDGASWSKDTMENAHRGFLTQAGRRVFLVALDEDEGKKIFLRERSTGGVWGPADEIVSESTKIETFAVPMYSPPNFIPVAWTLDDQKLIKVLRVPVNEADNNEPPTVTINSPEHRASFDEGEEIAFSGTAVDPEGEPLTYTWTSNIDGVIGTGESFSRNDLSFGMHLVTLEASDGELSGFDALYITVGYSWKDETPPTVSLDKVVLKGTAIDATCTPKVTVNGVEVAVDAGDNWGPYEINLAGMGPVADIEITACDSSGNEGSILLTVQR